MGARRLHHSPCAACQRDTLHTQLICTVCGHITPLTHPPLTPLLKKPKWEQRRILGERKQMEAERAQWRRRTGNTLFALPSRRPPRK